MKKTPPEELPEAANQKAIERHLRDMMGPPPQEATDKDMEEINAPEPAEEIIPVTDSIPAASTPPTAPEVEGAEVPKEPEPDPAEKPLEDTADIPEDEKTTEAVDDIVAKEGDTVLAAEDADLAEAFKPEKTGFRAKLKKFFATWWHNKIARWATIICLLALLIGAAAWPVSRYFLLNTAGVRGSASLKVTDDTSQQPVKNIQVSLGGQTALTDTDGVARLTHVRLGKSTMVIKKRAYAEQSKVITVGWGSNPLGDFELKATGSQFYITAKDYFSGKPIVKAQAVSGDAQAVSDEKGQIVLAVDPGDADKIDVTISAKGYRDEKISFDTDSKTGKDVRMVSSRKEVFVSKRSGTYDVYKIDVDRKNEKLVLKGTGRERDDIALVSHPTEELVALVSSRDNVRDSDGYLLSTLTLINLEDNSSKSLAQSQRITVVGWTANRLIYVQVAAGASAANPKRYRLLSYDYKTQDKRELAAGNYFNDVLLIGDSIYYAPTNFYQNDGSGGLFKSNGDGTTKQTILKQEVSSSYRMTYETLDLAVGETWYEYKLGTSTPTKLASALPNYRSLVYVDSPDRTRSLWTDERDGKGVLLVYNTTAKTDKVLQTQSGITTPTRWLNDNTVIYRIHTDQETADYVMNVDGGTPQKIQDVTNTSSAGAGHY